MNIFSKEDFINENVSFLHFDDSFVIEEKSQIVFGSNGIGKSSIFRGIKSVKNNGVSFLDYDPKAVKFTKSGKAVTISTNVQEIKDLESEVTSLMQSVAPKEILSKNYSLKSAKAVGSYNNHELNEAFKLNENYDAAPIDKTILDTIIKYIKPSEFQALIPLKNKLPELTSLSNVTKDYSDLYLLKVFEDMDGHVDSQTRKCPVCQTNNVQLENIIFEKKRQLNELMNSIFYPFETIRNMMPDAQEKAISNLISILSKMSEKEFASLILCQGDSKMLSQLLELKNKCQLINDKIGTLKAERTSFYKKMSAEKEFSKARFEREFPESNITFDDKEEQIGIELPRDSKTYSTGEFNEMLLIIGTLSFAGSSNKTLVVDDPLSSYDFPNQYRIIFRLAKLVSDEEKNVIIFTHNIDTINIMNTQLPNKFAYFYIEKWEGNLSILKINSDNIQNSLMSLDTLCKFENPYVSLLSYRENQDLDSSFEGDKVFHYDGPYTFHPQKSSEAQFGELSNEYLVNLIENINLIPKSSFEENTIEKIIYLAALRVWIEKQVFLFINSLPQNDKNKSFASFMERKTTIEKIRTVDTRDDFIKYYPKYNHTTLMMKKAMLNQNAHYHSQIIPFNFAINISLDELLKEVADIKDLFVKVD